MTAYYNEHDPFAAAWLRELIKAGHIPAGDVDERSIEDVTPDEIKSYTQCHFFAGIGGWPYALRLAGWPDDRAAWTGSAPCQPFSAAGKGGGFADERHLWPAFLWLISQQRPATVFGEQVASKAGRDWFDVVLSDLEAHGYAVGAADLCAAGVGAPHIRQRLYFVADAGRKGYGGASGPRCERVRHATERRGDIAQGQPRAEQRPGRFCDAISLGNTSGAGLPSRQQFELPGANGNEKRGATEQSGGSFWADAEWIPCIDGKARSTQSGLFPLANGVPARVGRLRGYGNAIVPPLAAEFVGAFMDGLL